MTENVSTVPPHEFRIGVTGHRRLADAPAVTRAVDRLLDYIDETIHRSSAAPPTWTVVSLLAKGADRIVADAALRRANTRLEVITPLPLDDYRTDFADAADREEFERLLARATSVRELGSEHPIQALASVAVTGAERNLAYFRAGEQVVDACDTLICIWNGRPAHGLGGTGDIARYALRRDRTVLWIHAERPGDPAAVLKSIDESDSSKADVVVVRSEPLP